MGQVRGFVPARLGLLWAPGSAIVAGFMAPERDLSGTLLAGRYRVDSQIGGGGMGTVHAGEHLEVGRKVAIKILRPESAAHPALVERFRREARLTARVEHEHVVECLDVGVSDDGLCFYVMEWLRGEDMHALLRRERCLPWPRARAIVVQICRALAAAHAQGVVHRDLKPGNVFLVRREDNPDFVKVLDFGIAKLVAPDEPEGEVLTRIGEVVGTTPYMAPEMAAGEAFDHRIDVYATGVILFQALCGRLPFRGKTPRQILTAILQAELPRLSAMHPGIVASPQLEALVARALHRDPAERYQDMAALHEALMALPEDACRPADDTGDPDSSPALTASESAMAASMIEPIVAGTRAAASSGSGVEAARTEDQDPPTRQYVPRRRRPLALVGGVTLAAAVMTWGLLRGPGIAAPGVAAEPEAAVSLAIVGPREGSRPAAPIAAVIEAQPAMADAMQPGVEDVADAEADDADDVDDVDDVDDAKGAAAAEPVVVEAVARVESRDRKAEPRGDFGEVMRRASVKVRRCLAQAGIKAGTRVRFDIVVEARTGRITAATPREPHRGQAALGTCVLEATRGVTVRPAPLNEWRRSHEFTG